MLAAKFEGIFPHLDERQRRLLMGAEARALGHGGIRAVARAAGVAENTVSRGVSDLDAGEEPLGRTRRPGGGRKRLADLDPGLRPALLALVEPDERGDPMSPLRWTTKSTRTLAGELTRQGHRVGADTVADLLRAEGFSLQANAKTIEGKQHPDRDAQFHYINGQVKEHQGTGDPVVSVDTKKKELVGPFANAGRQWRPKGEPVATRTHDFPDSELGKAVPYGVYDVAANAGWVNVGTDHDTAAFAVESIRRWWNTIGADEYPQATRLLITADAGGSNGYRTRAWKAELAALAVQTGLEITVCHFPPGTSKWNKVEHRLFSHITLNWRGRPLTSHDVIVQTIAATTTRTGLRVHAALDTSTYDTGIRVSDRQHDALPLTRHDWHGEWNYTLRPEAYEHVNTTPDPFDQPSPDLAWLHHPALTGLPPHEWDTLLTTLLALHDHQRETRLDKRRGHRPRLTGPGTGRRPVLTLADRLIAAILHQRLAVPQVAVAALFSVRPETINRHLREIRQLLTQAGRTIQPSPQRLATLNDLYALAAAEGIAIPQKIKTAR
ncbi:ISAzo13 family transposase [Micromonospora sicca]|uniref:ISAzo13 family transposase n=2 Tax=Micromonosporaceae TaxID=28056 RepID=A0A317DKC3_9ACTN|nr:MULTISPECIES: ISAzo13 family transposase [unclassified Micromonospora]MBM0227464.1 ISAzo13 family transposase [Micromonospora sp. ATA51]PWR15229.1 ISAzo13 family transposase [Micromonospora sp. 4G51]